MNTDNNGADEDEASWASEEDDPSWYIQSTNFASETLDFINGSCAECGVLETLATYHDVFDNKEYEYIVMKPFLPDSDPQMMLPHFWVEFFDKIHYDEETDGEVLKLIFRKLMPNALKCAEHKDLLKKFVEQSFDIIFEPVFW